VGGPGKNRGKKKKRDWSVCLEGANSPDEHYDGKGKGSGKKKKKKLDGGFTHGRIREAVEVNQGTGKSRKKREKRGGAQEKWGSVRAEGNKGPNETKTGRKGELGGGKKRRSEKRH